MSTGWTMWALIYALARGGNHLDLHKRPEDRHPLKEPELSETVTSELNDWLPEEVR